MRAITSDDRGAALAGLAARVVEKLRHFELTLCVVESCTGGLIASSITQVPGCSEVFWGGLVVYDNSAKYALCGVSTELLAEHGAVSPQVAEAMAAGGLLHLSQAAGNKKAGVVVSTTGIAGPGGGSAAKPVGLCHLGLARTGLNVASEQFTAACGLTRSETQVAFARRAMEIVLAAMEN